MTSFRSAADPNQLVAGFNDTWTVGTGQDTFKFNSATFGNKAINGFLTSKDVLQFSPTLFANYAAMHSATTQQGANTVIAVAPGETITLNNVNASALTASNFKNSSSLAGWRTLWARARAVNHLGANPISAFFHRGIVKPRMRI